MTERARQWVPAFVLLAAVWGSSFLCIKVAVGVLPPIWVTGFRVLIGALTLLAVLAASRTGLPRDWRLWAHLVVVAALGNVAPFTLYALGERSGVSSVLAGIWNATTPLVTILVLIAVVRVERVSAARVAGLLVGFLGVLIVLGVWHGVSGGHLTGQLMCFGAAVCYGLVFPYIRRHVAGRPESGVAIAAAQLLVASALLAVLAPLLAGSPPTPVRWGAPVVAAMLALGALGTGLAFVLNYRVIRLAGTATASSVTYLMPVFSTLAGALVLGEAVTWYEPIGALVILAGVALSRRAPGYRAAQSSSRSAGQRLTTVPGSTAQRAARSQP